MSYNFTGIQPEIIELLSINRFHDSKAFYEEHKEILKQGATVPMRQIVLDLSETMCEIDDKMYLNPVYTVSRIRRDTRRTKNKMLYRENLWLMLRRNKKEYPFAPFFWFEFSPEGYCCGIGFWAERQIQFDQVRKLILAQPDRWLEAVEAAKQAGLSYYARESYKKDKIPGASNELKPYLNAKDMEFSYYSSDLSAISRPDFIEELTDIFQTAEPVYQFFIDAYDNMIQEGLIQAER